ncbi:TauD/TfdA family dioxygenase [Nocardiopsis sp. DSM 44743]|uniref:TauD/TfdA family dioxygenase n=2 Tax=Nocardiopsis lambiniae TaxID=3075539 RepID=A0ABU2MBE7_9ACTN|nr:TauD/TfdA family dioxygenase [Nocardiopsis sp. DSM 44743]
MTTETPSAVDYRPPQDIIELTEHETAAIVAAALELFGRHRHRHLHEEALLYDVETVAGRLPSRLQTELRRFRDHGNPDGALVIDGIPVETNVPTPAGDGPDPHWSLVPVTTFAQMMVMSVLGSVIGYRDEKEGRLVQDVFPRVGQERRQENSGSVLLELHTEDGFLDRPPHYLSLICVRGDHDAVAATLACGIRRVLPSIPADVVAVLRRDRFQIAFSTSFTGGREDIWSRPLAVLTGPIDDPHLTVDFHGMVGLDGEAQNALDRLRELFLENVVGAVLRPGQLMIVDNRVAVHGRTSFEPRYDGTDRWLRRCFSVSDLRTVRDQADHGRALRSGGERHRRITASRA